MGKLTTLVLGLLALATIAVVAGGVLAPFLAWALERWLAAPRRIRAALSGRHRRRE